MEQKFTIVYEPAEEGGFTVWIPEIPGVVSQGETREEAREMVLDALRELMAYRRESALELIGRRTETEDIAANF